MFAIVEFTEEKSVSVVPSHWVLDRKFCLWPCDVNKSEISKLIQNQADPKDSWSSFSCRVMKDRSKLGCCFFFSITFCFCNPITGICK